MQSVPFSAVGRSFSIHGWRGSCSIQVSCLSPCDTLALYSDGVTESPNSAGEEFGDERLRNSQRHHRALNAYAMAKGVIVDVSQFSAGDLFDDITLIVAKRIGKA